MYLNECAALLFSIHHTVIYDDTGIFDFNKCCIMILKLKCYLLLRSGMIWLWQCYLYCINLKTVCSTVFPICQKIKSHGDLIVKIFECLKEIITPKMCRTVSYVI